MSESTTATTQEEIAPAGRTSSSGSGGFLSGPVGRNLGLVIALAIGMYLYTHSAKSAADAAGGAGSPKMAIDVTGVRNDLVAFATAERQTFALDGKYLSIDEMRSKGSSIPADHRGPFTYSSEVTDTGFTIIATYSGEPMPGVPKRMTIDQTGEIRTE